MDQKLENKIMQGFSWFEARNAWDDEKLGFGYPCECNDGWFQLIYDLCKELDEYYKSIYEDINTLRVLQIKEKYGTLCFYIGSYYGDANKIVHKYEEKSYDVCEICGEHGKLRTKGRWLKTLCETCKDKYGYNDYYKKNICQCCFESEAIKSSSVCKECKNAGEDSDKLDIVDEVGGCHGGGVGWNPQGIFCGECSRSTCKECINEHIKD